MHPFTHLLTGWALAQTADLGRRDRMLVTFSAVVPDVDGAGAVVEMATRESERPLYWFSQYHHTLAHNVGFALICVLAAWCWAQRRYRTAALVAVGFHLHLAGDLVGSGGPDDQDWPIPYLLPFTRAWTWSWEGQWALNAWPNVALTVLLILFALRWSWRHGRSPVELVSTAADRRLTETLRDRFGTPEA